ncbi:MAG: hypothetical protein IK083_07730 [Abditibacteriota bacterium]|nr:hypothetical protein [Abditibacteriota bacterium]
MTSTGAKEYLRTQLFTGMLGKTLKGQKLAASADIPGIQSGIIEALFDKDVFVREGPYYTFGFRRSLGRSAFSKAVAAILDNCGFPLTKEQLEQEICAVYPADKTAAAKLRTHLSDARTFFCAGGRVGLTKWLLVPADDPEEFDELNAISPEEAEAAVPVSFEDPDKALAELTAEGPLSMRALQYGVWKQDPGSFDPADVYDKVLSSKTCVLLGDRNIYSRKDIKAFRKELAACQKKLGDSPADPLTPDDILLDKAVLDDIVRQVVKGGYYLLSDALARCYKSEDVADEANRALLANYLFSAVQDPRIDHNDSQWYVKVDFEDEDLEDITEYVAKKGSVTAGEIIREFLDIPLEHGLVPVLKLRLAELMKQTDTVMITGETYSKTISVPDWVREMPESLIYTEPQPVEDMEGDLYDCMLEPEGFDPALRTEIYNPLAEDVGDEDPSRTIYSINDTRQRCVLKYHHKVAGTFPLCQIQPAFFTLPDNMEVAPVTISGRTVYINRANRLMYGMADFYTEVTHVSGAVFYLNKSPEGYTFEYTGETDKACSIDTNRSLELLELAEQDDLTVYDVICSILSRKPLSFAALYTEVNIVRRCSRLLIASILSSYHCFNVKGKSGLWAYDEKKTDQGFNKNKKKYIKK